jgi:hypothetical protein
LGLSEKGQNVLKFKKQVMKRRDRKIYRSVGEQVIVVNTALFRVDRFSETSQLWRRVANTFNSDLQEVTQRRSEIRYCAAANVEQILEMK